MFHRTRPTRTPARRAFTLIELIIVIVIILVLVSLSTSAVLKMIGLQQRRNTEQTVVKVSKAFNGQWTPVLDTAKTEQVHAIAVHLSGPSPGDNRRARVIHTLLCLRREFPMSFTEARNPVPVAPADLVTLSAITPNLAPGGVANVFLPNKSYVTALQNSANRQPPERESSGCVYLALKQGRRGMLFDPDTGFSSQELVDPAKDGVKEIYDAWSSPDDPRPIFLLRWPYGNNAPYGSSGVGQFQQYTSQANPPDPEDPEGLLANGAWQIWLKAFTQGPPPPPYTPQQQQAMQRLIASVFWWPGQPVQQSQWPYPLADPQPKQPPYLQYQLTPVIMSKGPNGTFPDRDDIYNFQLSSLGGSR